MNLSEFFHEEPESQSVFTTQEFFVDEQAAKRTMKFC